MIRDEQRAALIEAMADVALAGKIIYADPEQPHVLEFTRENWIMIMTAAFDAQHGLAFVDPVKATDEMIAAGIKHRDNTQEGLGATWSTMSAAGDLTKAPGTKL